MESSERKDAPTPRPAFTLFHCFILGRTGAILVGATKAASHFGRSAVILTLLIAGPVTFVVIGYATLFLAIRIRRLLSRVPSVVFEVDCFILSGLPKPRDGSTGRK